MSRKAWSSAALVLSVTAGVVAAAIVAPDAPASAHHGRSMDALWIQAMGRDRDCLDVPPDSIDSNGGTVQVYACHDQGAEDQANQRWYLEFDAAKEGYRIKLEPTDRCLDADRNHPGEGAGVQLWRCNGSDQQLWDLKPTELADTRVSAPVPAASAHPFRIKSRFHSTTTGLSMYLAVDTGRTVQIQGTHAGDKDQYWDGYELQCMHAYHRHWDSELYRCR